MSTKKSANSAAPVTDARTVRLCELEHDPISIAGHEGRLAKLDDLKASLPALGQLQSLKVRPAASGSALYWVTAGNRRLATLKALRDESGAVQGVVVTDDFPVHVVFSDQSDDDAKQAMVAENVQRLAPTPLEEAQDFADMASRMSTKEVASRFGVPKRYVEQRLKLAALHPDVQAALAAGKISLGAAEAFTMEPDPDRQAAYLKGATGSWQLGPSQIRQAFSQSLVTSDSSTAKLIGKDAYLAAGGQVMADSFTDGGPGYWISHDIIRSLLDAHWSSQRVAWANEGWAWVAEASEYSLSYGHLGYDGKLAAEYPKGEPAGSFSAEQKAFCGVIYWESGQYPPKLGVVDKAKVAPPKAESTSIEAEKPASLDDPGNTVAQDLAARLTRALRASLLVDTASVLRLLYAALASQASEYSESPAGIKGRVSRKADDVPEFADALTWASDQAAITLIDKIAELAAPSLAVGPYVSNDAKAALLRLLDPDAAAEFDAAEYFASVRKPIIALAWLDMTGEKLKDGKKGDMAALATAKATETGWLPPQLRGPRYPGPGLNFEQLQADAAEKAAQLEAERKARIAAIGNSDLDDEDDEEFVEDELAELEAAE